MTTRITLPPAPNDSSDTTGNLQFTPVTLPGGWKILRALGNGTGNATFLATSGSEPAVLKVMSTDAADDIQPRIDAHSAACRALAGVRHPALARTLDHGYDATNELLYQISEYVPGRSLALVRRECGPLAPGVAAALLLPIADALMSCHLRGVTHGRITPDHILLVDDDTPGPTRLVGLGPSSRMPNAIGLNFRERDFQPAGRSENRPSEKARDVFALAAVAYFLTEGRLAQGALISEDERAGRVKIRVGGQSTWSRRLRVVLQGAGDVSMLELRTLLLETSLDAPQEVARCSDLLSPVVASSVPSPRVQIPRRTTSSEHIRSVIGAVGMLAVASFGAWLPLGLSTLHAAGIGAWST